MHSVDLFTATRYATLLLNLSDHSDKSVIRNPGDQNTVKGTVSLHGPGWPCYYTNCDSSCSNINFKLLNVGACYITIIG